MPNKTRVQIARTALYGASDVVVDKTQGYATSIPIGINEVPFGVSLFSRAMHGDQITGDSTWSATNQFKVQPPAEVIGICMYGTGNRIGDFRRIDAAGNFVSSFNYQTHPIYTQRMRDVVVDNCQMKEFDTIYVKTAVSGPAGSDAAGKKCWWISTEKIDNTWRPHSAFKRNGIIKPKIWIGRYLGHNEGGKIGSALNQTVQASKTKAEFQSMINARNVGGNSGFRMFDIYDMSLLRMLLLIFGGGSDTQAIWGDNSSGTANPRTGSTGATAIGLHDLWRCYWYHTDLITVNSGTVSLTNPSNGAAINTGRAQPTSSGWIVDVLDGPFTVGEDVHDLLELFLPKTVNGTETNGTFADYHLVVSGSAVTSGMCASYTESYQSWEVVTAGQRVFAYDPSTGYIGGYSDCGCDLYKCAIGYAVRIVNGGCSKHPSKSGTWASGYPACPHGYIHDTYYTRDWLVAHCEDDSGSSNLGYRAPCGRTTHREGDTYGYVTRTRTTSYNKEAGCLSSTLYDKSDASISTRISKS